MLMMRARVRGHRWVDHPAAAVMKARVPVQWVDCPAAVVMEAREQGRCWIDHPAVAVMEARVQGRHWVDRPSVGVVQGTLSADSMDQGTGSCSQRGSKPSSNVVVKLEPAWSMKEEPQDEPPAVYSTVQPMSDNTSGSLPSLNSSHVCQRCFATFILFSSLELHMATFHGETLHKAFPVLSPSNCDVGCQFDDETDLLGVYGNKTAARERRRKGNDSDRTDKEKKMKKHVCEECGRGFALTDY
ncbi:hypothetical protein ACOMHN_017086 [Nucella lapillus]